VNQAKPFKIDKISVCNAWLKVKGNDGAAGIDKQSIADFESNLKQNLYKLWNRLSSGSYFPPAVRGVEIPKRNGKTRLLGIPTIMDRIAQTVVRDSLEKIVDARFHQDSYAYREGKSALDAINVTRQRCWKYNWVLEFDIKNAFDNIDHELLMKAVKCHTTCRSTLLYIERWLKAPLIRADGSKEERVKGTPQGGVISPLLFNIYLHYTFDLWMTRTFPDIPFARYADDGLMHCKSERQALYILDKLDERFKKCGMELNREKTNVIYCKDGNRKDTYSKIQFDFLGCTFRNRLAKSKEGKYFSSFSPAISNASAKRIRQSMRSLGISRWTNAELEDIGTLTDPKISGWWNYYGKFNPGIMKEILSHLNFILVKWVMRKHKRFRGRKRQARQWLANVARRETKLLSLWELGILPAMVEQ
jgi:group II intron reverse transcriptase/maturase